MVGEDVESLTREHGILLSALQTIANGEEPRPLGTAWRSDKKPSKLDTCIHGARMREDCGDCIAKFADDTLARLSSPQIERRGVGL